jgi:hypothetical protein
MNTVIQFTKDEEAKALPVLLRHSPGTVLPSQTYVVEDAVLKALRAAGVLFREVRPQLNLSALGDVSVGERI